ncbi:MAG: hypothetical protein LBJ93_03820 [Clostridiales bacterium]|nr:hypothetical protein [Clostridiales bacterium]
MIFSINLFFCCKILVLKKQNSIQNFYADVALDNLLNVCESRLYCIKDIGNYNFDNRFYCNLFEFKIKKYFLNIKDNDLVISLDEQDSFNLDENEAIDVEINCFNNEILKNTIIKQNLNLLEVFLLDKKNKKIIKHEFFIL